MRAFIVVGGLVAAAAIFAGGDGAGLARSVLHGFGWGVGREAAHSVMRHVLH